MNEHNHQVYFNQNAQKIENNQFEYIKLQKKNNQKLKIVDFSSIKTLLRQLNYEFKFQSSDKDLNKQSIPRTLVAVSNQQKTNYKNYGESISYDITYNCIKQKTNSQQRYGFGIFSGFDNNNRIIIFGFSITTYQTTSDFQKVFNWFFDLMGYTQTTAIITDQQKTLIYALEKLKQSYGYNFHHIYDNWHFIRAFKQSLKGKIQDVSPCLIKKIRQMMRQSDPNVGKLYLSSIQQLMINSKLRVQYQRLQQKLEHVCLWKMPKQFYGLSLHSNQCLNHLLKLKVEYQVTIYELIQKFNEVSKQRTLKSETDSKYWNYDFDSLFHDPFVQQVQTVFQKKAFDTFLCHYNRSQLYRTVTKDLVEGRFEIQHIIDRDRYQIFNNRQCVCGALQKTGVPCEHLIFITRTELQKKSYVCLFNERFLPKAGNKNEKADQKKFYKV